MNRSAARCQSTPRRHLVIPSPHAAARTPTDDSRLCAPRRISGYKQCFLVPDLSRLRQDDIFRAGTPKHLASSETKPNPSRSTAQDDNLRKCLSHPIPVPAPSLCHPLALGDRIRLWQPHMSYTQSTPSDIVDQDRHRLEMGWLVPVVIACIFGVINSFGPTLSSSFRRMQADPIDSRFNHYVLEHGYRIIRHTETAGTFWSPGFFFPTRGVLAYSDNLIGSAPVYWIWRLMFDPEAAFSLWMISCCILNFASFAAFGRRLRLHPCLIAAGAMIFAFGFHRSMLIKHQQMLPHFFLPLAIWAAWEWSRRPTLWKVAAVAVCIYLQLLCGIYLGWFLLFSLLILLPLLIIRHEPRREAPRFLRERWLSTGVVVVVFVGVMGATFWPYLGQHHGSAEYDWHEVQVYLPTARTFLPPWGLSDTTTSEAYFAAGVRPTLPLAGFVFSAGIVVLLFSMKRLLRAPDENASLAAAALIAGIVMALLSIRWGSSFSLWRIVYTIVPGAREFAPSPEST